MLRTLQYEQIRKLSFTGKILDVGGGKNADYASLLNGSATLESVNLDSKMFPSYIADLNEGLPFSEASYDQVISFNTLEHIRRDEFILQEMFRVLKNGGKLYLSVPFLYRVHGSPSDFHRHTAYWWEEKLESLGFQKEKIRVKPLVWDFLSTGFALTEGWTLSLMGVRRLIPRMRRALMLLAGLWPGRERSYLSDYALGYFISAEK